MTLTDSPIVEQLELLAAAFPWEAVALWIKRSPEGRCEFTAVLEGKQSQGMEWRCATGNTPAEAVSRIIQECSGRRDPEILKQAAIRELEEKLSKLRALVISLPPYKPGCYIEDRKAEDEAKTIDV